ncbi:MAG TPA: uracil-DNA glycosylase [Vicinamibacteria bacterium]|nr:uracil-DNA glycosylase [Vicinamibacteria bacterium]
MADDSQFVVEQIRERLRFYSSLTSLGFPRTAEASRPKAEAAATAPLRENETLEEIRADLGECTRCRLSEKRSTIVFGVGNPKAELMFVGEGPGREEDRQGLPFVGDAGQLLNKIIQAIDLTREQVYIANVVKCRPPNNRDPEPDEVDACRPFLDRQIDAVRPKVICALGRISALNLLRTDEGITRLRGKIFSYRGAKLVPTYHPAFLLRNPGKKRECWEDMKLVKKLLSES